MKVNTQLQSFDGVNGTMSFTGLKTICPTLAKITFSGDVELENGQNYALTEQDTLVVNFTSKNPTSILFYTISSEEFSTFVDKDFGYKYINFVSAENDLKLSVSPNVLSYGQLFEIMLRGDKNKDYWFDLNGFEVLITTNDLGWGTINLHSAELFKSSEHIRVYNLKSIVDDKSINTDVNVSVVPSDFALKLNIGPSGFSAITSIDGSGLESGALRYPSIGLPEVLNSVSKNLSISGDTGTPTIFNRPQSISSCKLLTEGLVIAISALDQTAIDPTVPYEVARNNANRIFLAHSTASAHQALATRKAIVVDKDIQASDCSDGLIKIKVDDDIWPQMVLNSLYVTSGDNFGKQFSISSDRTQPGYWFISSLGATVIEKGDCFYFTTFRDYAYSVPAHFTKYNHLPYIEYEGLPVSAINPQVVSNYKSSNADNTFVYVVAEANIDGSSQLFFTSFNLTTNQYSEWTQLTFAGNNRNARLDVDKVGNIYIVWESDRCGDPQLYCSVIGPDSRIFVNQLYATSLIKTRETTLEIDPPMGLNLRNVDEYGVYSGNMWNIYKSNTGTVVVNNDSTITLSGNGKTSKFAAFGCLKRDEFDYDLDYDFSQLSYQVSFDLNLTATVNQYDDNQLKDLFSTFKDQFAPYNSTDFTSVNTYTKTNNRYTIKNIERKYDTVIPLVGAYKTNGICGQNQTVANTDVSFELRHWTLAAVPEIVSFSAKNTETYAEFNQRTGSTSYVEYFEENHYTGKYKLLLVKKSSNNLDSLDELHKKESQVIVLDSNLRFNSSHNFKIPVHYTQSLNTTKDGRYLLDLSVLVDNEIVHADNYFVEFGDEYNQIDVGLGNPYYEELLSEFTKSEELRLLDNLQVGMAFSNVAIGPHSIWHDETKVYFSPSDRNTSRMFIASQEDAYSVDHWELIYGPNTTKVNYQLDFGLSLGKINFSALPITGSGYNINPSLATNANKGLEIAWQSNRDGNWQIYTSKGMGAYPFLRDVRITKTESPTIQPSIAVDEADNALIAWTDGREKDYQIFTARRVVNRIDDCKGQYLSSAYGLPTFNLNEYSSEYNEYEYSSLDGYSGCVMSFYIDSSLTLNNAYFEVSVYLDEDKENLYKVISSLDNADRWFLNFSKTPADGVDIAPGVGLVDFYPGANDFVKGQTYYCTLKVINYQNGVLEEYKGLGDGSELQTVYYCSGNQAFRGSIGINYFNPANVSKNLDFRVTFYSDEAMIRPVYSSSTLLSDVGWRKGNSQLIGSLAIAAKETATVYYVPRVKAHDQAMFRDYLLEGSSYWVKTEYNLDGTFYVHDTYRLDVPYGKNKPTEQWKSSAFGYSDVKVGGHNTINASVTSTPEGIFYISYQHILGNAEFNIWDAKEDAFYNAFSGWYNTSVDSAQLIKPIVSNLLNPVCIYVKNDKLYGKVYSFYQLPTVVTTPTLPPQEDENPIVAGQNSHFYAQLSPLSTNSVYTKNIYQPINSTEYKDVYIDIYSPKGAYAARLKNEGDDHYSEWKLLNDYDEYNSQISNGQYQVQWTLSAYSGLKTISIQLATFFGTIQLEDLEIIAEYNVPKYSVEYYFDDPFGSAPTKLSKYKNYSVASTNKITIDKNILASINAARTTTNTIYVKVVFENAGELYKTIDESTGLTFDLITQNNHIKNLPLVKKTASVAIPTDLSTYVKNGTYYGSFNITKQDDFKNIDGLAFIKVNIPNVVEQSLDNCQKLTYQDVISPVVNVDYEAFKLKYSNTFRNGFVENSCDTFDRPEEDAYVDDLVFPPISTSPADCRDIDWSVAEYYEPCFNNRSILNSPTHSRTSPEFILDFSQTTTDYLRFTSGETTLDGIIFMIKPYESIVIESAGCGESVTYKIPNSSIIFGHTSGYYYCHGPSTCGIGSSEKIVYSGNSIITTINEGTLGNNGTDSFTGWNLGATGCIVTNFASGVSKANLLSKGFISTNGKLRFKLVHIATGTGAAEIRGMTCGATCND